MIILIIIVNQGILRQTKSQTTQPFQEKIPRFHYGQTVISLFTAKLKFKIISLKITF